MNMNDHGEIDTLISACLDGCLSDADAGRLSRWIEESSEVRQRYWELASVHARIEQSMQSTSMKAITGQVVVPAPKSGSHFRWSRITSVAAGILIGIFSASMVWAYAVPLASQAQRVSKEIVFESFEDPEMKSLGRFPTNANQWFGGMFSVPGTGGMPVVEGTRVGQFANMPQHRFSYARYVVDLDEYAEPSDEHTRSIEVSGSFFHRTWIQLRFSGLTWRLSVKRPRPFSPSGLTESISTTLSCSKLVEITVLSLPISQPGTR